jgi:hypothetical protein
MSTRLKHRYAFKGKREKPGSVEVDWIELVTAATGPPDAVAVHRERKGERALLA